MEKPVPLEAVIDALLEDIKPELKRAAMPVAMRMLFHDKASVLDHNEVAAMAIINALIFESVRTALVVGLTKENFNSTIRLHFEEVTDMMAKEGIHWYENPETK